MFKQFFILGLISSIASSVAGFVYLYIYNNIIQIDFSEAFNLTTIVSDSALICFVAAVINFALRKMMKKHHIADFILNTLLALLAIGLVFLTLKSEDPVFQNEDTQIMVDYYKGFVMPTLFFPALAYFMFKPLVIRN